jgi:hypothetical protein
VIVLQDLMGDTGQSSADSRFVQNNGFSFSHWKTPRILGKKKVSSLSGEDTRTSCFWLFVEAFV